MKVPELLNIPKACYQTMKLPKALIVLLATTLLVFPSFDNITTMSSAAATPCFSCDYGAFDWILVTKPALASFGGDLVVIYSNQVAVPLTGFVYGVVHNQMGQTVSYVVTTMNLAAGAPGTTYLEVWANLPPGNYTVSIFATSEGGVAISNSTSVLYKLHE